MPWSWANALTCAVDVGKRLQEFYASDYNNPLGLRLARSLKQVSTRAYALTG